MPQQVYVVLMVADHLVNFMGLVGIVNANILKTETNFHKSRAWQIVLIFKTGIELVWPRFNPYRRTTAIAVPSLQQTRINFSLIVDK